MKNTLNALGLAMAMTVAGCDATEPKPMSVDYQAMEKERDTVCREVENVYSLRSREKICRGRDGKIDADCMNNLPEPIRIPPAPEGSGPRMVGIEIVGTLETNWVPKGYLATPLVKMESNGTISEPYGLMVSCPDDRSATEFKVPKYVEEFYLQAGEFKLYWSKTPGKKTKLMYAPDIIKNP